MIDNHYEILSRTILATSKQRGLVETVCGPFVLSAGCLVDSDVFATAAQAFRDKLNECVMTSTRKEYYPGKESETLT